MRKKNFVYNMKKKMMLQVFKRLLRVDNDEFLLRHRSSYSFWSLQLVSKKVWGLKGVFDGDIKFILRAFYFLSSYLSSFL